MAERARPQGFLRRLAQLPRRAGEPYQQVLAEITRNLTFVFNTRKACGALPDFGLGDYEDERNIQQAVEALRVELLAAVRRYEPRLDGPQVKLRGRHGYNMVRFEVRGVVEGRECAIDVDIDSTTRHVDVGRVAP